MPPRKKKPKAGTVGLSATEVAEGAPPRAVEELAEAIAADGGVALSRYREPFGGSWIVLASLPLDRVQPTPFQRELSKVHSERLAGVIPKVGRFLDPVIATRMDGSYWTPNGMHRLAAMKALGARAILALVLPEHEVAYRILALNTEKAHNLKDKSLEVIRMMRSLAEDPEGRKRTEADLAFEFEEPAYPTIGACYEKRPRFSGGAYLPIVKRCEEFSKKKLPEALEVRDAHAARLLEIDDLVVDLVARLKAAGLKSPYLKPFVVARINPLRWVRATKPGEKAPRASFDGTLDKMEANAGKLDPEKVRPQDLAVLAAAGPPPDEA
jgi:ParB family chromosome partitioning protein